MRREDTRLETYLRSRQPVTLGLEVVHLGIESVEVLVSKERVVGEVELSSSVMERVVVSLTREVEPLRRRNPDRETRVSEME